MIFLKSITKKDGQWKSEDVSAMNIADLDSEREDFRIAVKFIDGTVRELRANTLRELCDLSDRPGTVEDFVNTINGLHPTLHDVTYLSEVLKVRHTLLTDHDVTMELGNNGYGLGVTIPVPDRKDIAISSNIPAGSVGSITHLSNNCLFLVNGRVHRTIIVNDRLFIIDAGYEVQRLKGCVISVIDFSELGGIDVHHVSADDIMHRAYTMDSELQYKTKVMLKLDDLDIQKNKVLLFEAGYYKDQFTIEDETHLSTTVMHGAALDRLLTLMPGVRNKYYTDLEKNDTPSAHALDVPKYLTQGDTMVVSIRNTGAVEHRERVETMELVGHYRTRRPPCGILLASDNTILQYRISVIEDTRSTLCTLPNQVFKFLPTENNNNLDISLAPYVPPVTPHKFLSAELIDIYALRD